MNGALIVGVYVYSEKIVCVGGLGVCKKRDEVLGKGRGRLEWKRHFYESSFMDFSRARLHGTIYVYI